MLLLEFPSSPCIRGCAAQGYFKLARQTRTSQNRFAALIDRCLLRLPLDRRRDRVFDRGAAVAVRSAILILANCAIFAIGMLRVASALLYKKSKQSEKLAATKLWEHVYEYGAWAFAALLGLLFWLTLNPAVDASLQMAVTTSTAGYAAAISGRNAGRPLIAFGQLTFSVMPMVVALLIYPDWVHNALGVVVLLFMYGITDITLSTRNIIVQALTMTRKSGDASGALRRAGQPLRRRAQQHVARPVHARPADPCRFGTSGSGAASENAPVRVGMRIAQLSASMRAGNHKTQSVKQVLAISLIRRNRSTSSDLAGTAHHRGVAPMMPGGARSSFSNAPNANARRSVMHLARFDELTGCQPRPVPRASRPCSATAITASNVTIHLIDLTASRRSTTPGRDRRRCQGAWWPTGVIGPADMITRFGGDEFVVLQIGTERQQAKTLAQHWRGRSTSRSRSRPSYRHRRLDRHRHGAAR